VRKLNVTETRWTIEGKGNSHSEHQKFKQHCVQRKTLYRAVEFPRPAVTELFDEAASCKARMINVIVIRKDPEKDAVPKM
jgi:hypothetical protein